jgi:hypothetical protein
MSGLIAWTCRTPRRLGAVIVVPCAVLVVIGSIWSGQRGGSSSTDTRSGQAAAANAQIPNATPFVTAAVNFVNVWGRLAPGQTTDQWHSAVRTLATAELASALDQTDPHSLQGSIPAGKPTVRYVTPTDAIVAVPLENGRSVVVSVIASDGKTWLVRDIEPDAGN